MNPRSEPLLWVQLISLGALPLELLLLLLVLAGSDPGPLPQLERLLTWALGALAPAIVLWRRPADLRSLLVVRSAVPQASALQCCLAARQTQPVPRLVFAAGVVALLPLLGWLDAHAALASHFSPLADGPRLTALLLSVALMALIVWQWQQLVQAGLLLLRGTKALAGVTPLTPEQISAWRSNPGLALLLLPDLDLPSPAQPQISVQEAVRTTTQPTDTAAESLNQWSENRDDQSGVGPTALPETEEGAAEASAIASDIASDIAAVAESSAVDGTPTVANAVGTEDGLDESVDPDSAQAGSARESTTALQPAAVDAAEQQPEAEDNDSPSALDDDPGPSAEAVAVEPEQSTEKPEGSQLDEQVTGEDLTAGS